MSNISKLIDHTNATSEELFVHQIILNTKPSKCQKFIIYNTDKVILEIRKRDEINQINALGIIGKATKNATEIEGAAIKYATDLRRSTNEKVIKIEDGATEEANEKINKAKIKALKIETDATEEADETTGKANDKALKIENDAKEEALKIENNAKKREEDTKKKEEKADEIYKEVEKQRKKFELDKANQHLTCPVCWYNRVFSFIWENRISCSIGLMLLSGGIGYLMYLCHHYTMTRYCNESYVNMSKFDDSKLE
jgi:hypothetical protein